ncbi:MULTISPECIES: hypothetical protein [Mycolicibacterium]|uniref:hypothetical protein n=1 Tax=Mycolicibacterium TaxID=1866885 RepID=UPI000A7594D1|nr:MULTISPECIES: hypothetical protein [Mycolicibacterium]MCC9182516.1 hypothetical protein [Mycolicibacterium mageritense]
MAVEDSPRPGRRLTARGAATRARIVSAAAELMYLKGVTATTLDERHQQVPVPSTLRRQG